MVVSPTSRAARVRRCPLRTVTGTRTPCCLIPVEERLVQSGVVTHVIPKGQGQGHRGEVFQRAAEWLGDRVVVGA